MATITSRRPQSPASSTRTPQLSQSPSFTPTSSVRPSLDLPTNARSSSPTSGNPAQRRNRAALRDYYKLKSKGAAPSQSQSLARTASITSAASDGTITSNTPLSDSTLPPELDDTAFDAEAYVQALLKTSNLKSILRIEASLISEIKNLDGERKSLVYDNYSKLIKATQTIGNMQKSMNEGNVGSLEKLQPAVEGIARMAADLDRGRKSGAGGHDGRESLRAEKQKREAVRWVVGAPGRFEGYVEEGQMEEMKSEWKSISKTLDKWQGVKGVDEIRINCEQIMKGAGGDAG